MDKLDYLIQVEVPAIIPKHDLVAALQMAFDNGAQGFFKVVSTGTPGYMITFLRTVRDDELKYVLNQITTGQCKTVQEAAQLQLSKELDVSPLINDVVTTLRSYEGHVLDFYGVLNVPIPFDSEQAGNEGWGMFNVEGRYQLQRCAESGKFKSDADALLYVANMASAGESAYHLRAIEMIGTTVDSD